jgi:hypothetical protein
MPVVIVIVQFGAAEHLLLFFLLRPQIDFGLSCLDGRTVVPFLTTSRLDDQLLMMIVRMARFDSHVRRDRSSRRSS